jgi:hypothetical protein
MPTTNSFTAGNIDIKDLVKDDYYISKELTSAKDEFCNEMSLLFINKKIKCNEVFPIYYINKYNDLLPKIENNNDKIKA